MKTACRPNSASSLNRFQTISPWLAILPTVFQAFRVGERKPPRTVLSTYPHLEDIPKDWQEWSPPARNARLLANSLFSLWTDALLFRTLATLRTDVDVFDSVDRLEWKAIYR